MPYNMKALLNKLLCQKMACSKNSYSSDISNLCEDLLIEILTKLPPKSFFRSKCVSRSWYRLLSSDHIQSKLPYTISGVYYHPDARLNDKHRYASVFDGELADCNLGFFPFHSDSRIISCCNGLLLFCSRHPSALHVCNPIMKRWITLPSSGKESRLSVLVFDPCLSPHFKVVCFTGWRAQRAELQVFSSETGSWVEFSLNWEVESGTLLSVVSYFNGVLYILSYPQHIVGIDLENMTCRRIELPELARGEACIGKSGGRLQYYTGHHDGELRIWMLVDLNKSTWVLKHSIADYRSSSLFHGHPLRFLAFHPVTEVVYFWAAGKLLSYDVGKKRFEKVWELGKDDNGYLVEVWLFPFSRHILDCLENVPSVKRSM